MSNTFYQGHYSTSNIQWKIIEPFLPSPKFGGRPALNSRTVFNVKIKEILFNPDKKDEIRCSLSIFAGKVKIECDLYFIYKGISDKNYSYLLSLKDSVEKFLIKNDRLQNLSKR